jgi:hypothetical protein
LKQLDQKSAQAFAELRAHPAFRVIQEFLKEDEAIDVTRSLTLDGAPMYRMQGAVSKIRELLALIESAPSVVEKIKRQTG